MEGQTTNFEFKKRIHFEANKYLDILTIVQQLEKYGFIDKVYTELNEVYEREHTFTMNELRKVAKEAKNNQEVFNFMEHYQTNTSIFKKNLVAVLEMLVETIWNSKLNKVNQALNKMDQFDIQTILTLKNSDLDKAGISPEFEPNFKPDKAGFFDNLEKKEIREIKSGRVGSNYGNSRTSPLGKSKTNVKRANGLGKGNAKRKSKAGKTGKYGSPSSTAKLSNFTKARKPAKPIFGS